MAIAIASYPTLALAQSVDSDKKASVASASHMETVYVYGEQGKTDTATKLNLTLFETPQTVTAISRAQMDDFALNNISDLLNYTPGVTVEEVETDRTYYTARGFDIVNFQYDGVGVPFVSGLNLGQQDTAIYEKVEVVKGAAGLITGLANPSATINYVRKRPTDELQIGTRVSANEWNGVRLDGDISGALSANSRGRLVVAREDSESYLDRHEDQTDLMYGIVEVDLTERTLLTLGHSYNKSASDGVMWGALPLRYADGTPTDYDVSTSNAPDWTFADSTQNQTFVELEHQLTGQWLFNAIYTRNTGDFNSELFYVYGAPSREDETGLNGWASAYSREETQENYDLFVSGGFQLGGREHQVVVGYNHSDIQVDEASFTDPVGGFPVLGSDWAQGNTPRPDFVAHNPATDASDIELSQKALYVSARLNATDNLSLLLGARRTKLDQKGISYGGSADAEAEKTVPYYGVTYEIASDLMAYGSYSEVFKQQTWVNDQLRPLGAAEGDNTEIGLKKSFNNERAILTLALFQAQHSNLGEFVGRNSQGIAIYEPRDIDSQGYEVELSGELIEGLNISAGFTRVDLEDDNGEDIRPYVPSKLVKMSASYRVPALPALKLGGVLKWQDDITTSSGLAEQQAYTLLDLALHYELSPTLSLAVNLANVTDEKYLNSLYWDQAFYGAPRNVQASVAWRF
ncbi:TonB-dependent siderophore receptor [Kineobactrum sediminis]|uniref:TonB-dependent siderophore receptor n=2 Tax=Kineobactrum sediminis TaxID=1905677 RepID=A0A2N5Y2C3_9GAMM|nr:TonB-dependent siderophore receptor [Kineobactrum sediminis]